MKHDAMFKMLLKAPTVLRGFFDAFLPEVARFIDFQAIEFVDKERHTFHARKRTGDLLIKTRFQGKATGFLIHLEHQAQRDTDLYGVTRTHHGISVWVSVGPWAHLARRSA